GFGPDDLCPDFRYAETAFFKRIIISILIQYDGVYKNSSYALLIIILVNHQRTVYDKKPNSFVDLWSSQADSIGMVHGVKHVLNHSGNIIPFLDLFRLFF